MKQPEFIPGVRSRLDDSLHSTIRPERALFGGITFPNLHHKHEPIHRGKLGYGIDCGTCPCFTWFLPPRIGRFLVPAGSWKTLGIAVLITLRRVQDRTHSPKPVWVSRGFLQRPHKTLLSFLVVGCQQTPALLSVDPLPVDR